MWDNLCSSQSLFMYLSLPKHRILFYNRLNLAFILFVQLCACSQGHVAWYKWKLVPEDRKTRAKYQLPLRVRLRRMYPRILYSSDCQIICWDFQNRAANSIYVKLFNYMRHKYLINLVIFDSKYWWSIYCVPDIILKLIAATYYKDALIISRERMRWSCILSSVYHTASKCHFQY